MVIGKERRILNTSEAYQFLISALGLFAKTGKGKPGDLSTTAHVLSGSLNSPAPLKAGLSTQQFSEASQQGLNVFTQHTSSG